MANYKTKKGKAQVCVWGGEAVVSWRGSGKDGNHVSSITDSERERER